MIHELISKYIIFQVFYILILSILYDLIADIYIYIYGILFMINVIGLYHIDKLLLYTLDCINYLF